MGLSSLRCPTSPYSLKISQIAAELPEIITCTQIRALCHGAGIVLHFDTLTGKGYYYYMTVFVTQARSYTIYDTYIYAIKYKEQL